MQQINIPNVTEIGPYAFCNCEFLQQISLPNSITKIGQQAFQYTLLEEITIPNKITKLEFNTFYECRRLKKVILPKNLKIIENAVFSYCVSLQEIHIPDTVTEIGDLAFYDCESLQEINIPDNIEDIGSRAFERCENLKTIYVSRKNYEKFKNWDFGKLLKIKNNSNLVNETFNNEIQAQEDNIDDAIQELNFISYKDDEYLKFFKNVQEIINKQLVKKYLLNKKQVRFKLFGDNLQRILRIDFYTHSINTISDTMIADSYELTYQLRLDNIIKDTFSVHEYYPNINEVYLYSQDLSKYKGVSTNKLIYKNINGIYYYMNNVNAEKVAEYFIDKIKDIMNLTETFNNEIQAQTIDLNNIIKELNKNQYLQKYGLPIWQGIDYRCDNVYKGYQAIEEYIRDTEESIKSEIQYAIRFNRDPKSIKNKNILASIYNHGINYFYKGEDLDLNYEDSCNVWKLTKYLVRLYKDLQNELDNIKNNYVYNIQNGLIDDMKAFKEVFNTSNILDETFNNEIQAQEGNIDDAIDGVTYIKFKDPLVEQICHEKLHVYTYEDAKKIIKLDKISGFLGSNITSFNELKYFTNLHKIGVKAFARCKTLQEITLPNNVTEIQFMAFAWCSSLQQINIPNNLNIIGDNTFEACSNLKNINIPSTVTKIGRAAFIYCQSLQNINIPNGITEILRSTFKGCKSLQNIIIPKKVTFIDAKAFASCKALQEINIPDGVTNIEAGLGENGDIIYNAFENCSNLKTIYVSKLNYERLRNCSEKLLLRLKKVGLEIEPKLQWINLLQIKDNLLTETFNNEIQAKKDNIEDTLNNKLSFVVSRDKFIEILEKDLHNFTKIDENTRFKNDTDWIGKYIEGGLSRSMNFCLGKFINQDESDTTIMETSIPSIFLEFLQENPKNANDNDPYLYAQVGLSVSFQPIAAMGISKLLNSTSIKSIYQQVFKYSNETIIGKTKVFKLTIGTAKDIANLINTINTDNFRREYMKMLPSKPGDLKKLFINYYKKYIPLNETFNNDIQS